MSDLTEFLLARIAEDEEMAKASNASGWAPGSGGLYWDSEHGGEICVDPARVLAERRIVEEAAKWERMHIEARTYMKADDLNLLIYKAKRSLSHEMLRYLALPYADHPDYDEAWRP